MKVVVGLGNPGSQYSGTRHNVGFDVIDELARRWQLAKPQLKFQAELRDGNFGGHKVLLVTPQTFMNRSGESVQQIVRFYQVPTETLSDSMVVICDDMNLPLGRLRWRASGSSGGQKGLADILLRLGSDQVPRLRLGVGRPPGQMDPAKWVLAKFRSEEQTESELMTKLAADSVELWVKEGIASTMNRFNRSSDE
ncbi:MAG: aminoacyl-tRNA hydrolase [Planctomycetaceae bacterium]|nr:aminoacyl-tRNA hydrolase [Planctomycetaceae bacterium]